MNLSINETYTFISLNVSEGCQCQNCGTLIKNVVTLEDTDGKRYIVGTECADTLATFKKGKYEYEQARKVLAKNMRYIRMIKKLAKNNQLSIVRGCVFDLTKKRGSPSEFGGDWIIRPWSADSKMTSDWIQEHASELPVYP